MKDFYKKLVFYYLDCNGKKHQKTKNAILLNPYTDNDLKNIVYDFKDQILLDKKLGAQKVLYCRVILDKWDRHYYVNSVNYYFNDKKHSYKYL